MGVYEEGKANGPENEEVTKTAIIQPPTHSLFHLKMVEQQSWRNQCPVLRSGSYRLEGYYDSIHEDGINAGNRKGSLVNACVKWINGGGAGAGRIRRLGLSSALAGPGRG